MVIEKKEGNGYFQKNQFICPHHARQKSTIRTAAWVYFASLGRFGVRLKKNEEGGSGKNFFYQGAEHSRVTILNRALELMKFYTCFFKCHYLYDIFSTK